MRDLIVGLAAAEQREKQRQPLPHERLPGEVADRLAAVTLLGDRKWRREREIGIFRLLRESVMLQMIGPVTCEVGAHRDGAQPLSYPLIDRLVGMQPAMGGFMHQDRQPELARADDRARERTWEGMGPQRPERGGA